MYKSLSNFKNTGLLLAFVLIGLFSNRALAQNASHPSRVAISIADTKTAIWISDFPKKTTVMLVDSENNLLGIISTNEYGAAYTTIDKPVLSAIVARTLNGEINVTNKAIVKTEIQHEAIASTETKPTDKA